jgi:DNA adenine methylase
MSKKIRPPFKISRGKFYLSSWIITRFPDKYEELTYIEPYSGSASVLLNKKHGPSEALNDLDLGIIQIFRALRDEPRTFIGRLKKVKYCEETFWRMNKEPKKYKDYMEQAVKEFVSRRMSHGGLKQSFAINDENAWNLMIEDLPRTADRVAKIHIFNKPALDTIRAFDGQDFLCYCDPPNEENDGMTIDDHIALAEVLRQYRGKALVSGTSSKLYRRLYEGWKCARKTNSGRKAECLWMNY